MKRIAFTLMCAIALISFRAQAFTLEDITSEKFRPHDVAETYPSTDGVHYYAATNGNGRMARNALEKAILNQSRRLIADPGASLELLLPGDFELD